MMQLNITRAIVLPN